MKRLQSTHDAQRPTSDALNNSRGKTIANVEFGFEDTRQEKVSRSEKIIFHFTDSSALALQIVVGNFTPGAADVYFYGEFVSARTYIDASGAAISGGNKRPAKKKGSK